MADPGCRRQQEIADQRQQLPEKLDVYKRQHQLRLDKQRHGAAAAAEGGVRHRAVVLNAALCQSCSRRQAEGSLALGGDVYKRQATDLA